MKYDGFDWNRHNINKILDKHKISQSQVEQVFKNHPLFLIDDIRHSYSEERYIAFGKTDKSTKLIVAFTFKQKEGNKLIRPITARKMTKNEKRLYYEKAT